MKASSSIRKGWWLLPSLLLLIVLGAYNNCSEKKFSVDAEAARSIFGVNPYGGDEDKFIGFEQSGDLDVKVNKRPPITINRNDVNGGQTYVIDFDVTPKNGAEIKEVKCFLDGNQVNCDQDPNNPGFEVPIDGNDLDPGYHVFTIQAEDDNGGTTIVPITWGVFEDDDITNCNDVLLGEEDQPSVDIVIIVDNSYSMKDSQADMAGRVNGFMSKFSSLLNYRIGVITTDSLGAKFTNGGQGSSIAAPELGRGSLLQMPNGQYFIDTSVGLNSAQSYLSQTIQRSEIGNGAETGLTTLKQLVLRSKGALPNSSNPSYHANDALANSNAQSFIRQDAALIAIILTDEDETPHGSDGYSNYETPMGMIDAIKGHYPSKHIEFHSIIIAPGDDNCRQQQVADNPKARFGSSYMIASQLTGGFTGNICASDYGQQLGALGDHLANLGKKLFSLSDIVADADGDGDADITIRDGSGNLIGFKYIVNGDKVEFERALNVGEQYSVQYSCVK